MLQSFDFGKSIILVLVFPFSGGGTYDKVSNVLRFLVSNSVFGFRFGFVFALKCISQAQ
jgi:hypothetical protein